MHSQAAVAGGAWLWYWRLPSGLVMVVVPAAGQAASASPTFLALALVPGGCLAALGELVEV